MLVDHCCVLTDSLPAWDLFGFRRRYLPLCISAVALKLLLTHADDQRDEFALGTVNATMALHGGQRQGQLTSCSASSAIVQRGVDEWKTTSHSPSRASAVDHQRQHAVLHHGPLPSTYEFMQSARIACPSFTRPRFELGLSARAPHVSAKRVRLS